MNSHLSNAQRALLEAALHQRADDLERRRAEHQGGLSRAEHASELLTQDSDDLSHRADARELDMTLAERELAELGAVSAALQRLKDGRLGLCADCAQPIAFERLQAEPWALRCIECEGRRERATRH
jgi:DnaK suppressor protein